MISPETIAGLCDLATGAIAGRPVVTRRLSEVRDAFADQGACDALLRNGDPVVYTVSTLHVAEGAGQLQCGLGVLHPGSVGEEYFLTRGHFHARREASELYVGLQGAGLMLLEGEDGSSVTVELTRNGVVYVPGHTAHRTINTGKESLIYIGVYPADAGHDYDSIRAENFRTVVVLRGGKPVALPRTTYLRGSASRGTP